MKMPWTNLKGPARLLVLCVTILLVSSGLCGLQLLILNGGQSANSALSSIFILTGLFELGAMILSAIGGLVALVFWIGMLLTKRSSREP